ncbi:MAG: FHA domain-containing protein, partial [Lentilitoribacter sp.]
GALCSDWVDFDLTTVSTQTKRPRDKSKPVSTRVRGAFLKKLSDPSSGKIINVQSGRFYESKGVFYIGRTSERSDLVISSDNTVSRIHCRIVKKDTGFILADGENLSKGSTGGTFLNGRQLDVSKNYPLKHGDKIRIGQSELQFLLK